MTRGHRSVSKLEGLLCLLASSSLVQVQQTQSPEPTNHGVIPRRWCLCILAHPLRFVKPGGCWSVSHRCDTSAGVRGSSGLGAQRVRVPDDLLRMPYSLRFVKTYLAFFAQTPKKSLPK